MNTYISNCCSAKVAYINEDTMTGMCKLCKEWCEIEREEDDEMTLGSMDRF